MPVRTATKSKPVPLSAMEAELKELRAQLTVLQQAPAAPTVTTKHLHMVIFNADSSLVGWPSTERDHPGYAIEVRDFIVPNKEDQEELATNWMFQGYLEQDPPKLIVKYLERIPQRNADQPANFEKLSFSMKNDILEIVYGDDFNFNHKSSVMPIALGGQMDFPWIESYYRPMLMAAREYLRKAKAAKHEQRIAAIDAHLLKLKNINL